MYLILHPTNAIVSLCVCMCVCVLACELENHYWEMMESTVGCGHCICAIGFHGDLGMNSIAQEATGMSSDCSEKPCVL